MLNLLANLSFDCTGNSWVADTEETTGRSTWRKPVAAGQTLHQRLKVHFQVHWRVLMGDLPQRLHCLVSHHCLFNCSQTLQRGLEKPKTQVRKVTSKQIQIQSDLVKLFYWVNFWNQKAYKETVHIFRTSNQHGEVPQLLSKGKQNFIFIIDGIWSITKYENWTIIHECNGLLHLK